jgi:hypothetical protein
VRTSVTPSIYLAPFGPNNGARPATLLEASDGKAFTAAELLWLAWKLPKPHLGSSPLTRGIGLHRAGFQRKTPSYYIWGALSRLDS